MLVDVGALNLLLLVGPTRSPELLVLYNVAALVLANANSYVWNTLWTFKDQAQHDVKQVGMFTAPVRLPTERSLNPNRWGRMTERQRGRRRTP